MAEVVINGVHRHKHKHNLKQNDSGSNTNSSNNDNSQHFTSHPLDAADKFYHPYEPYDVQLNLMKSIYDTIDNDYKLGLFESPTGTGKTLSIICSTMTWLRTQRQKENAIKLSDENTGNGLNNDNNDDNDKDDDDDDDDDEPDWVKQAYREKIIKNILTQAEDYERHLQKLEKEGSELITNELEDKNLKSLNLKKRKLNNKNNLNNNSIVEIDENNCILDNYNSDDEEYNNNNSINKFKNSNQLKLDNEIKELLLKLDNNNSTSNELIDKSTDLNESNYKIFFSSRTHSQLDQFADQLKLIKNFPSSLPNINEKIKYLPLGSRKQLCINEEIIQNYTNINDINDACLNLQKAKTNNNKDGDDSQKKNGCKYYINNNNKQPQQQQDFNQKLKNNFRDLTFSSIHDIEDLNKIGKHYNICPYYSSRDSIFKSEIISLPYQLLLSKQTREILNINKNLLKNSIIVIDEAHNLIDTISNLNSCSISINLLIKLRKILKNYINKFFNKLNSGNRINLSKLLKLITNLLKFLNNKQISLKDNNNKNNNNNLKLGEEINLNDFLENSNCDLLNINLILKYLDSSKLAFKLDYYIEKFYPNEISNKDNTPLIFKLHSFLISLSNPSKSGRFFYDKNLNNELTINYNLLDPSDIFKELIDDCKCMLLTGGTMEPIQDFTKILSPHLKNDKIKIFNCDHIIPDKNLKVFQISNYCTNNNNNNTLFDFSFKNRYNEKMLINLGFLILNYIKIIPKGLVLFFTSYKYLEYIIKIWENFNILNEFKKFKKIFIESKEISTDKLLSDYSFEINNNNKSNERGEGGGGAILFSVIGGKLSEGINFSNDLARSVILIGLPYPNVYSGELIAKKNYIFKKSIEIGDSNNIAIKKSNEFIENICMKAVNQSVGRAIRNINDYAVIMLIDYRYKQKNIENKLSHWIKKRIIKNESNDIINKEIVDFFKDR